MADLVRLSKFLSAILRHRAGEFGIVLDAEGFTDVDAVWALVEARYPDQYQYADLLHLIEMGDGEKKRFEIVGARIRARYGHTAVQTVTYPPEIPPEYLYHGTTPDALPSIRREGLTAQQRQYVHLSLDPDWAQTVGKRRAGKPVVLRVRALEAHAAGHIFYHPEPKHYLCEAISSAFIDFPDEDSHSSD
jgi:putative RNA 2'-phosphotransferase